MTVKIDRYESTAYDNGNGCIDDLLHGERIVRISTRNEKLTRKLVILCLDYLNQDEESND